MGELLAMRAFQLWGKATTMPVRRPLPLISSSPPTDTWRGLVEQWIAGTHTALESVKGFTRFAVVFFLAGFGKLPPVALVGGVEAFAEPPLLPACLRQLGRWSRRRLARHRPRRKLPSIAQIAQSIANATTRGR